MSYSKIFDGLMAIGQSWNITLIDGIAELKRSIMVVDRRKSYYKGLEDILNFSHIYEMSLLNVENFDLAVLICSQSDQKSGTPTGSNPLENQSSNRVEYKKMVANFRKLVRQAVLMKNSSSQRDMALRNDHHIIIKQKDWTEIGESLQLLLATDNHLTEDFPVNFKAFFLLKKMGQDIEIDQIKESKYRNLQFQYCTDVCIHVAFDFSNPSSITWWAVDPDYSSHFRKKEVFLVGLVPGAASIILRDAVDSESSVRVLTRYTRLFHSLHRDSLRYFDGPKLAKLLAEVYAAILAGKGLGKKLSTTWEFLGAGGLENFFERLNCSFEQGTFPGRLECVCKCKYSEMTDTLTFKQALDQSEQIAEDFCLKNGFFYETNRIEMKTEIYHSTATHWFDIFGKTILKVISKIKFMLTNHKNLHRVDPENVLLTKDFVLVNCSEGIITMIIRGQMRKFPSAIQKLVQLDESLPPGCLEEFPFGSLTVLPGGTIDCNLETKTVFRNFAQMVLSNEHELFSEFLEAYSKWKKVKKTALSTVALKNYAACMLELVLQNLNGPQKTNLQEESLIRNLWVSKEAGCQDVKSSICFLNTLTTRREKRSTSFTSIHSLLDFFRQEVTERTGAGLTLILASAVEELMQKEVVPLQMKVSRYSSIMFLPIISDGNTITTLELYKMAYKKIYIPKEEMYIQAHKYLRIFVTFLSNEKKLPLELKMSLDLSKIFAYIYEKSRVSHNHTDNDQQITKMEDTFLARILGEAEVERSQPENVNYEIGLPDKEIMQAFPVNNEQSKEKIAQWLEVANSRNTGRRRDAKGHFVSKHTAQAGSASRGPLSESNLYWPSLAIRRHELHCEKQVRPEYKRRPWESPASQSPESPNSIWNTPPPINFCMTELSPDTSIYTWESQKDAFDGKDSTPRMARQHTNRPYTRTESLLILQFIIRNNLQRFALGKRIYEHLESLKIVKNRSAVSMHDFFRKQLWLKIMEFSSEIGDDHAIQLRNTIFAVKADSSKQFLPTEVLLLAL